MTQALLAFALRAALCAVPIGYPVDWSNRLGFSPVSNPRYIQKTPAMRGFFVCMADRTGLEPATSGVTGRHSNQLNYRSAALGDLVGGTGVEPVTYAL